MKKKADCINCAFSRECPFWNAIENTGELFQNLLQQRGCLFPEKQKLKNYKHTAFEVEAAKRKYIKGRHFTNLETFTIALRAESCVN